jgi:hypothetical protein
VSRHVLALLRQLGDRIVLVYPAAPEVSVDGDRGDESVVLRRAREELGRGPDESRQVPGRIDDGVPVAPDKFGQVAITIATQVLHLREEARVGAAPIEESDRVASIEGDLDDVPPEKKRPPENE